ncbi:hypothetical protein [Nocardia sp. XZ_19_369]|uniref:hypothetical protein n=1 Tax=Nocardia sp. XZ_19_369 TaxID=2769487 RepID=UPI00188FA3B0|nr:hypothetical protein [Nocardia sp. XZ_19_369]
MTVGVRDGLVVEVVVGVGWQVTVRLVVGVVVRPDSIDCFVVDLVVVVDVRGGVVVVVDVAGRCVVVCGEVDRQNSD